MTADCVAGIAGIWCLRCPCPSERPAVGGQKAAVAVQGELICYDLAGFLLDTQVAHAFLLIREKEGIAYPKAHP